MNAYKRFQYSPFDILVFLSGILCITMGYYYFISAPWQSGEFRSSEPFGIISSGNGTRKLGNSLQWFEVYNKSELFYGDVIFANEQKDIEITLLDKESKLLVPEDSMIKITKDGDEFNLDVSKGSVLIKTQKRRRINLRDKRGRIRKLTISRNSRVKISSKKSNMVIEAIKGNASIINRATKKPLRIQKGKLLLVGPKESKVFNKSNLLKVKAVDPVFTVSIPVKEKFRKLNYFEVSKKSNFKSVLKLGIVNGQMDIRSLTPGEYFVREPKKFAYDSFEIKQIKSLKLSLEEKEKYYKGDKLRVNWNGRSELMYRLEVVGGEQPFNKLVQGNDFLFPIQNAGEIKLKITEQIFNRYDEKSINIVLSEDLQILGIEELKDKNKFIRKLSLKNPRNILYKLEIKDQDGKIITDKLSRKEEHRIWIARPGRYTIRLLNLERKIEYFTTTFVNKNPIYQNNTKTIAYSATKGFKVKLKWRRKTAFPKEIEYILRIYSDREGKKLLGEKILKTKSYDYIRKKTGKVYWSVDSNQPDLVDKSPLYPLELSRPKMLAVEAPKIILKYKEKGDCYSLDLPKSQYAKIYDTYIYSSKTKVKGSYKKLYRKRLKTNNDCIKSKGEGKYFYKYKIEDIWGRQTKFSKMGTIYFPISPLDDF